MSPQDGHERKPKPKIEKSESLFLPIAFRGVNTLEIIDHARQRMKQRGISQDDVINALKNPTEERPSEQMAGRTEVVWNKTAMVRIKVVFEQKADRVRVITAAVSRRPLSGR
ncbi:MAG: DUF4258 domain-containing protein [Gemmataceae bacterium]|nr:DUF4258 domain-containing protein [Gemmataceae bacterium]